MFAGEAPLPCGRCHEVPEQLLEIIEVVIENREELARWESRNAGQRSYECIAPR
jgi:hypothetical protein